MVEVVEVVGCRVVVGCEVVEVVEVVGCEVVEVVEVVGCKVVVGSRVVVVPSHGSQGFPLLHGSTQHSPSTG